jgi:hypothetical protein
MARRSKGGRAQAHGRPRAAAASAAPTPIPSSRDTLSVTPAGSVYTSACHTEDEGDIENDPNTLKISSLSIREEPSGPASAATETSAPTRPFRFMDLPSELRLKVYAFYFSGIQGTVDLAPENPEKIKKSLTIMRTCRQVRAEATHYLFSSHVFRVFPTRPGRSLKTKKPLLARLKPYQRHCLTTLEFRVGPDWGKPPRSWVVNPALGLSDCINVRLVNVFIEIDPSDDIFKGFRGPEGFYENFCRALLNDILDGLPAVEKVQFDAWPSVKKRGAMVQSLLEVTVQKGKTICWGPERGWTDADEIDNVVVKPDVLLRHGGKAVWIEA